MIIEIPRAKKLIQSYSQQRKIHKTAQRTKNYYLWTEITNRAKSINERLIKLSTMYQSFGNKSSNDEKIMYQY